MQTLLVGFGFAATTFHLPFLNHHPQFSVSGVVSSNPAKVHALVPGCQVWANLEDALSQADFDLVVITTPNDLHATQAGMALDAGAHVLVEKPFTLNTDDARSLIAKSKDVDRKLCVYHNRRFDGDFITVQNLIKSGMLGDIKHMASRFDRFRPEPRDRWRENAGPGSGIFWDLGPHLIDQAMMLFGKPQSVHGRIQQRREGAQTDDAFDLCLQYAGFDVHLASSPFVAHSTLRFDINGTKGSYRKYGLDPQEEQLKKHVSLDDAGWGRTVQSDHGLFCGEHASRQIVTEAGDYRRFYAQLHNALEGNGELPAPAQDVLPVISLIETAHEQNKQQPGRSFSFDFE